jgi:sec-independent protein translocase protein TatB
MFDIGFAELLLLAVIGMVVIGPERLPGVVSTVGRLMGKARRFMTSLQSQIEQEMKLDELNKKIMAETDDLDFTKNTSKPADDDEFDDDEAAVPTVTPTHDLPEAPGYTPKADTQQVEQTDDTEKS